MTTTIDLGVLELLASKICHDLISPIGAVNNGIEILDELGPDAGDEVTGLISYSAAQASAKLQAYRMAYGAGGADTSIKPEDVHKTFESIVGADKKVRQDWDPHAPLGPAERPSGFSKMLMAGLLLCLEALPKGGSVALTADGTDVVITAKGTDAGLREGTAEALSLALAREKLEPKFMHAYITGLIAGNYGYKFSVDGQSDGEIRFRLVSPTAA